MNVGWFKICNQFEKKMSKNMPKIMRERSELGPRMITKNAKTINDRIFPPIFDSK
jgi:hypothetical protein